MDYRRHVLDCMLLCELHIPLSQTPIIWCDNVGALALATNLVFHSRTKHVEIDVHFVREKVRNKDIVVRYISTHDQLADIFTKGLTSASFQFLQDKLMVLPPPST